MFNKAALILMIISGQLILGSMFLAFSGDNNSSFLMHTLISDIFYKNLIYFGQSNWLFVFICVVLCVPIFWLVIVPSWINGWIKKRK